MIINLNKSKETRTEPVLHTDRLRHRFAFLPLLTDDRFIVWLSRYWELSEYDLVYDYNSLCVRRDWVVRSRTYFNPCLQKKSSENAAYTVEPHLGITESIQQKDAYALEDKNGNIFGQYSRDRAEYLLTFYNKDGSNYTAKKISPDWIRNLDPNGMVTWTIPK